MAAAIQVLLAELLDELEVVEAVRQGHGLLQADVFMPQVAHDKQARDAVLQGGEEKKRRETAPSNPCPKLVLTVYL